MSIARATALLVTSGIACAAALAFFFHSEARQGVLLYTPGANAPAQYTPAGAAVFIVGICLLLLVSVLTASIAGVLVWVGRKKLVPVAKTATFCGLIF